MQFRDLLMIAASSSGGFAAPLLDRPGMVQPVIAYSTTRLTGAATRSMQVGRAADGTLLDIGFLGNDLDGVALDAFRGASPAPIVTLYNQGTAASSDATQATAANRPSVHFYTAQGHRVINFDGRSTGVRKYMDLPAVAVARNNCELICILRPQSTRKIAGITHIGGTTSSQNIRFFTASGGETLPGSIQSNATVPSPVIPPRTELIATGFGNGASGRNLYENEVFYSSTAPTSFAMSGGRIGDIDATTPFQGDMCGWFLFDRILTTNERNTFLAACYDFFGIAKLASTRIIWDGDSITEHSDTAENGFGYGFVRQTYPLLTKPVHMYNCGVGGARLGTGLANFSTAIAPLYDSSYSRTIIICGKKTNDLGADARTAAAVHADEMSWCALAKALGPNVIVLVPELLPQNSIDSTKFADYRSRQAGWAGYADGLIAFGSSPTMGPFGSNNDHTRYPDGLHPNSLGAADLTPYAVAAINPWLL